MITPCGRYRYALCREWIDRRPTIAFIMLNPSTADASRDDPTIRRCIRFARDWGFGKIAVGNLYALRSPHPDHLATAADPVGPENDRWLREIIGRASTVVVAWGACPVARARAVDVLEMLSHRPLYCLGTTRDGHPRHPLYVPGSQKASVYREVWKSAV